MRKILIPVLLVLMLVGCGNPKSAEIPNPIQPATAETQPKSGLQNPVLVTIEEDEDAGNSNTEPTDVEQPVSYPQAGTPEKEPSYTGETTEPCKPDSTISKPSTPAPTETTTPEPPADETTPTVTEPEQVKPTQPTPSMPSEPSPTAPSPTEPTPSSPAQTEPTPSEPKPTEPEPEVIDTTALEAYGRAYASSAYGYNGTSSCGPGSGAGFFPGATKEILTMTDGYSLVCRAIDAQYARDIASGYPPYEEIDGVTVRCPINVRVEPTGQANMYVIWIYYGGA
jgi:hypothetical protein